MKHLSTLIFMLFFLTVNVFSQEKSDTITVIKLPEYYKGEGVIFSKEFLISNNYNNYKTRFTPNIENISNAEKIFVSQLNQVLINDNRSLYFKPVKNVRKRFKKWNRQYIGYIDKNGDKIIFIILLNFSTKRVQKSYEYNWKNHIIFGCGEFYEKNTKSFIINLNKNKLDF